jgi:hypothetical protein
MECRTLKKCIALAVRRIDFRLSMFAQLLQQGRNHKGILIL